jgi:hypothetical protein
VVAREIQIGVTNQTALVAGIVDAGRSRQMTSGKEGRKDEGTG